MAEIYDELNAIKQEIAGEQSQPRRHPFPEEQKRELIEEWNNKPEVKLNNIEAIDKNKKKPVKKERYKLLMFLAIIGTIALLIIAGAVGIFGYIAYQDGTFINPIALTCGNTTLNVESTTCPEYPSINIPSCPSCQVTCPDVNIKNYLNGSV